MKGNSALQKRSWIPPVYTGIMKTTMAGLFPGIRPHYHLTENEASFTGKFISRGKNRHHPTPVIITPFREMFPNYYQVRDFPDRIFTTPPGAG
jgi:hypothetical protein